VRLVAGWQSCQDSHSPIIAEPDMNPDLISPDLIAVAALILAYLMGSVSAAILVCRAMGLPDPRTDGSRNPGTTNVLRIGGKPAAILTLAGDMLKGVIPVVLARKLDIDDFMLGAVGLAAFIGHLYPVFFRCDGGKGVATALGVMLALNPGLGLATLATWLIVAYAFRYSSLAALVAAVFAPFYYGLLFGADEKLFAVIVMSALLLYRHAGNISNLLAGKESRIGSKAAGAKAAAKKK